MRSEHGAAHLIDGGDDRVGSNPTVPAGADTAPLTPAEIDLLATDEAIIDAGIIVFFKVGMALARIRDQRLYRAGYGTFEEYVDKRWHMSRTHAYRLIESGEVVTALSPNGDVRATDPAYAANDRIRTSAIMAADELVGALANIVDSGAWREFVHPMRGLQRFSGLIDYCHGFLELVCPDRLAAAVVLAELESAPVTPPEEPATVSDDLTDDQIRDQFDRARAALIGMDPFVVGLELAYLIDRRVVTTTDPLEALVGAVHRGEHLS